MQRHWILITSMDNQLKWKSTLKKNLHFAKVISDIEVRNQWKIRGWKLSWIDTESFTMPWQNYCFRFFIQISLHCQLWIRIYSSEITMAVETESQQLLHYSLPVWQLQHVSVDDTITTAHLSAVQIMGRHLNFFLKSCGRKTLWNTKCDRLYILSPCGWPDQQHKLQKFKCNPDKNHSTGWTD